MPSKPSPARDHWAAFEAEVLADERLPVSQRRRLARTSQRQRVIYGGARELLQLHVINILRAEVEVVAGPAAKRLVAIDLFNRTSDQFNRMARRLDRRQDEMPGAPSRGSLVIPSGSLVKRNVVQDEEE